MMNSEAMNDALNGLEVEGVEKPVFYWGWYWRDVDFDADSVWLAVSPEQQPAWATNTLEARMGQPYWGRKVGFCENNKWGYAMFEVKGEQWDELRRRIRALIEDPTPEASEAVNAYMAEIAPADSELEHEEW